MKKSTKIIIAVVSVIVVAAAVVATLFLTGVIGGKKEPKKAFYEYLEKATEKTSEMSYSDMLSAFKKSQTEPAVAKGKMTMDVELAGQLAQYKDVAELLSKIELNIESKTNPSDSAIASSIDVKYDGKDLGKIEILGNEEEFGVRIADVYDKYLAVTMEEITDMLEDAGVDLDNLNMSSLSTEDVDTDAMIELLEISDEEINRIVNRYKEVLKSSIPEKNYSTEKEKITVNDKEINATGYTVKISDEDLKNLIKEFVKSLKEDNDTLELIVDKANKIMEIAGESSTISKRDLTSMLDTLASSLEESDEILKEELKITIYEYKDETVRISVSLGDDGITIDSITDKDTTNMALKVKSQGTEMTLLNIEETKKGEGNYSTKLSTDLGIAKFEITMDVEEADKSVKENLKMYIEMQNMIKATLNMESEVEYTSVSIDKLTSSNSVKVSELSDTDALELVYGLLDYVDDKMDVIKEIAEVLGLEDEVEELETQLNTLKTQVPTSSTLTDDGDDTTPEE